MWNFFAKLPAGPTQRWHFKFVCLVTNNDEHLWFNFQKHNQPLIFMFLSYLQIIKLNYYHSGKSERVVSLSFGCSHLVCAAPRVWRADGVSNPNYRGRSWCGQASHQPGSRGARGQGQPIPGDYRHNKVCFRQCCVASFFVSPLASGVKAAFKISSKKQPNK